MRSLPAGTKLLGLVAVSVLVAALPRWWQPAVAVVVLVVLCAGSGVLRVVAVQTRPLLVVVAAVAVFHVLALSWRSAVDVVASLLAVVLAASLVTATTTTTAMINTVVRGLGPFRRVGVDPERVGLMLALSVRSVTVVAELAAEIREAQQARGLRISPRSFGVPLLVRSLRHATRLGEALLARGVDD